MKKDKKSILACRGSGVTRRRGGEGIDETRSIWAAGGEEDGLMTTAMTFQGDRLIELD
jgi:hypothetical protein